MFNLEKKPKKKVKKGKKGKKVIEKDESASDAMSEDPDTVKMELETMEDQASEEEEKEETSKVKRK